MERKGRKSWAHLLGKPCLLWPFPQCVCFRGAESDSHSAGGLGAPIWAHSEIRQNVCAVRSGGNMKE